MKKRYLIIGLIGLILGVGSWFAYQWWRNRNIEVIREGSFEITIDRN